MNFTQIVILISILTGIAYHNIALAIAGCLGLVIVLLKDFSGDIVRKIDVLIRKASLDKGIIETQKNRSGNEYELVPRNDAIVSELMAIRLDLVRIRVRLQEKTGWDTLPDDFLKLFYLYSDYPYSALCTMYEVSKNKWGGIVILLDYFDDDIQFPSEFRAETLRKIKSVKENRLAIGMELPVYFYDPEVGSHYYRIMTAEVLSIIKNEDDRVDDFGVSYTLTLKINIFRDYAADDEIIRKIEITRSDRCDHNLVIEEKVVCIEEASQG